MSARYPRKPTPAEAAAIRGMSRGVRQDLLADGLAEYGFIEIVFGAPPYHRSPPSITVDGELISWPSLTTLKKRLRDNGFDVWEDRERYRPGSDGQLLRKRLNVAFSGTAGDAESRIAAALALHAPRSTGRVEYTFNETGGITGTAPTFTCPEGCKSSVWFFEGDECATYKALTGANMG